ncbi:MAG: site-specific integrase [Lentisphaeraceae bacterium]|nr:site-specific integrase [Lentisphaeraceae bacterium]
MNRRFNIKTLTFSNGSEFACLTNKEGVPTYYENLYIIQNCYYKGKSLSSSVASLTAIKLLANWEDFAGVNIPQRFSHRGSLSYSEIRSICSYARRKFKAITAKGNGSIHTIPISSRVRKRIKNTKVQDIWASQVSTQRVRISYIKSYLDWLHVNLFSEGVNERSEMLKNFKNFLPLGTSGVENINSGISEDVSQTVLDCLQPGDDKNFFGRHYSRKKIRTKEATQLRNYLMIAILYHTGMRMGELLALRIEDINFNKDTVEIVRRQDDGIDKRKVKPHAKTRGRVFHLNKEDIDQLNIYITKERAVIPKAGYHPFIFVSHQGQNAGEAFSIDGLKSVFEKIRTNVTVQGINDLSPHNLRYAWNYRYSKHCDMNRDKISLTDETEMRCYLMGWSPRSKMSDLYNKRHIIEQSAIVSVEMQADLGPLGKEESR